MIRYSRGKKTFTIDTSEFDRLKDRLTGEELRKATKSGLRKGSKILVSETKERFNRLIVKHKGKGKGRLSGYNDRGKLLPVATSKIYDRNKRFQPMATVSIRVRNRTDFRSLFFELGTGIRRNRNAYRAKRGLRNSGRYGRYYPSGMSRGRILEGRYFRRAQQSSERRVFNVMELAVNGHIIRQANKK